MEHSSMNERIKAVGRQAGLVFIEDGVYGQRWYSSKCGLDAAEYEKLVKMIVQECGNWIVDNADAMEHLGPSYFAKAMQQHFGVAE
jgi:hypothetical protein